MFDSSWDGPEDDDTIIPQPREVVVKDYVVNDQNRNMVDEHKAAVYVSNANSTHIVKLIRASDGIAGDDPIALRQPDLTAQICRLYLEYCPLGDLSDLIRFRVSM